MDYDFSILEKKGISVKEGLDYTGSADKYVSALQRYFKNSETNRKSVQELADAGDIEGFTIKVHALKSNSKMIGAGAAATAFEELELAGRSGNTDDIKSKTPAALELYAGVIDAIRPFGEMDAIKIEGELSADEAQEVAEKLLAALDDFDDEASLALATKLMGYPFRITQKNRLKEARDLIGDFMYDEAAEIVREIEPAIE